MVEKKLPSLSVQVSRESSLRSSPEHWGCVVLLEHLRVAIICAEDENTAVAVLQPKWTQQDCNSSNFFCVGETQNLT